MQNQGGQGSENLEQEQQRKGDTSDIQNESQQDLESRRRQGQGQAEESE